MIAPKQQKHLSTGVVIAAASLAAVAGAIFLYGTESGSRQRKKISSWMLKAKAEVLEKLEALSEVSEEAYQKIVDTVTEQYRHLKNVDPEELKQVAAELRGHWSKIRRQITGKAKTKSPRSRAPKK